MAWEGWIRLSAHVAEVGHLPAAEVQPERTGRYTHLPWCLLYSQLWQLPVTSTGTPRMVESAQVQWQCGRSAWIISTAISISGLFSAHIHLGLFLITT